jgi:hypothetical protein
MKLILISVAEPESQDLPEPQRDAAPVALTAPLMPIAWKIQKTFAFTNH